MRKVPDMGNGRGRGWGVARWKAYQGDPQKGSLHTYYTNEISAAWYCFLTLPLLILLVLTLPLYHSLWVFLFLVKFANAIAFLTCSVAGGANHFKAC